MAESPSSPWVYDRGSRRFRDTRTGRWLSPRQIVTLRDRLAVERATAARASTLSLAEGSGSLRGWVLSMRRGIKETFGAQFALGRGGRQSMTPSDWGKLGSLVKEQYRYLNRFAGQLADGKLTARQAAARAELYMHASGRAHAAGQARAWGIELPAHPGDGSTECLVRCLCFWRIEQGDDGAVEATWTRTASESCRDCVKRAANWAPYTIPAREDAA